MLALLALAAVSLITLGFRGGGRSQIGGARSVARDIVSPLDGAARAVFRPVADFVRGGLSYSSLRRQNSQLRQEVAKLRSAAAGALVTQGELAQLARLEHLTFAQNLPKIQAEVLSGGPSNFQLTVQLDKGTAQGVKDGMPVVAGGGLVGSVVQTSKNRSTVLLATDPSSAVGVRIGSATAALGVAVGQGANKLLSVEYVHPGQHIVAGQEAVTTQVRGGTLPPGIPVGTVTSAHTRVGALQQTITLRPFVDYSNLAFVSVLRWTPPKP